MESPAEQDTSLSEHPHPDLEAVLQSALRTADIELAFEEPIPSINPLHYIRLVQVYHAAQFLIFRAAYNTPPSLFSVDHIVVHAYRDFLNSIRTAFKYTWRAERFAAEPDRPPRWDLGMDDEDFEEHIHRVIIDSVGTEKSVEETIKEAWRFFEDIHMTGFVYHDNEDFQRVWIRLGEMEREDFRRTFDLDVSAMTKWVEELRTVAPTGRNQLKREAIAVWGECQQIDEALGYLDKFDPPANWKDLVEEVGVVSGGLSCPVCYQAFPLQNLDTASEPPQKRLKKEHPPAATPCGHVFRWECLEQWFNTDNNNPFITCPISRKILCTRRSNDEKFSGLLNLMGMLHFSSYNPTDEDRAHFYIYAIDEYLSSIPIDLEETIEGFDHSFEFFFKYSLGSSPQVVYSILQRFYISMFLGQKGQLKMAKMALRTIQIFRDRLRALLDENMERYRECNFRSGELFAGMNTWQALMTLGEFVIALRVRERAGICGVEWPLTEGI